MKYIARFAVGALLLAGLSYSLAFESGGPNGTSGAPGQSTCAQSGCHNQFPVNSGPGIFHIMAPENYTVPEHGCPPETSDIRIHVVHEGMNRWGFQLTTRDSSGFPLGHMEPMDTSLCHLSVDSAGREYVSQTAAGTFAGQADSSGYWWTHWVPEEGEAQDWLVLYVSAVAADGDGTPGGDYVYAYSLSVYPGWNECFGALNGDMNQSSTVTSADIIFLVNFVFKSGPPPSPHVMYSDIDCNGSATAGDIIRLVNYVFKGGGPPCDLCSQCCYKGDSAWVCP